MRDLDITPTPPTTADLDPLALDQRDAAKLTDLAAKTLSRLVIQQACVEAGNLAPEPREVAASDG